MAAARPDPSSTSEVGSGTAETGPFTAGSTAFVMEAVNAPVPGFELGRISQLAFGFFCGFGLTHYYLDSRIWRVRHDPSLRQALALA